MQLRHLIVYGIYESSCTCYETTSCRSYTICLISCTKLNKQEKLICTDTDTIVFDTKEIGGNEIKS